MTVFIAFFRGVNVGRNNRIKMADLRDMLMSMSFARVETYLQSGNVLFDAIDAEEGLPKRIEDAFAQKFGFSAEVILRTAAELKKLVLACPFSKEEITETELFNAEGESFYVALLSQPPARENIASLSACGNSHDVFRIQNRDVYLLFRHSIRHAKLANNLKKLGVPMTIRNWRTITRLQVLAAARIES